MDTTTPNETIPAIAAELAPKIMADPAMQAAAKLGPEAYNAALLRELPRILDEHRAAVAAAYEVLERKLHMTPSVVVAYFGPRIHAAVNA